MRRIDHPHVAVEGVCGPSGHLFGNFHASCPVDGLTWQCGAVQLPSGVKCGCVYQISWAELDALNVPHLDADPSECVHLPPCPQCGGETVFNHNDVEYGQDLPEHYTMKILREHIAVRPAFARLRCHGAAARDGKHQGFDFSHLPKKQRPEWHCKVDLAAQAQERAVQPEPLVETEDPSHPFYVAGSAADYVPVVVR